MFSLLNLLISFAKQYLFSFDSSLKHVYDSVNDLNSISLFRHLKLIKLYFLFYFTLYIIFLLVIVSLKNTKEFDF